MKKVQDGQFVMHGGIAKIVRLGRGTKPGKVFVEWTEEGSGDITHAIVDISVL